MAGAGQIQLDSVMDNTGNTLSVDTSGGSFTFTGGSITGGNLIMGPSGIGDRRLRATKLPPPSTG